MKDHVFDKKTLNEGGIASMLLEVIRFLNMTKSIIDGSVVFLFEPFHGVFLGDFVFGSDSAFASSSEADSASWSLEDNVEVHSENTSERVILDTQIDMLLNSEAETSTI